MQKPIIISDHAILRYMERILGFDMEVLRQKLTKEVGRVAGTGAKTFTSGGVTYVLETLPSGGLCVVTVLTEKMRSGTHHRQQFARRRKAVAETVKP
jgi:hypothetical protein